MGKNKI
jgi:hypothetical protein